MQESLKITNRYFTRQIANYFSEYDNSNRLHAEIPAHCNPSDPDFIFWSNSFCADVLWIVYCHSIVSYMPLAGKSSFYKKYCNLHWPFTGNHSIWPSAMDSSF